MTQRRSKTQARRRVRNGAVVTIAVCAALVLAALPVAASTQIAGPTGLTCSVKRYRILFWPLGHPAVPSVGFGSYTLPHLELYANTGTTFPNTEYDAFLDATGSANYSALCTGAPVQSGTIPRAARKSTTSAVLLTCTFTKVPTADIAPVPNGASTFHLTAGKQRAAEATFNGESAKLTYNKKVCKASAAPK
jgi:hypothetical protein